MKTFNGFIYLLQTRESIRMNDKTYKIGHTKKTNPYNRLIGYASQSIVFLICGSPIDSKKQESRILDLFKTKYERNKIYGNEYFVGDVNQMIDDIMSICGKNIVDEYVLNSNKIIKQRSTSHNVSRHKSYSTPVLKKHKLNIFMHKKESHYTDKRFCQLNILELLLLSRTSYKNIITSVIPHTQNHDQLKIFTLIKLLFYCEKVLEINRFQKYRFNAKNNNLTTDQKNVICTIFIKKLRYAYPILATNLISNKLELYQVYTKILKLLTMFRTNTKNRYLQFIKKDQIVKGVRYRFRVLVPELDNLKNDIEHIISRAPNKVNEFDQLIMTTYVNNLYNKL